LTCEKFEMLTESRDIARGSFRPAGPARELPAFGEVLYVRKFLFDFPLLCVARHALIGAAFNIWSRAMWP
jgi:hypothetical protein